tara:strand:+ start:1175 stop:1630 length:456 start_codon:yes stop_codon:yes gene_type:complete
MYEVKNNTVGEFQLDARLAADCELVTDLGLCRLLLMNNASVPWFILVPKLEDAIELTSLPMSQQEQILQEINQVAAMVTSLYTPDKLNVGALGNVVCQLHIHVIGRFTHDLAWPNPVWGQLPDNRYQSKQLATALHQAASFLGTLQCIEKI